jgi:hypothetical protein
MDLYSNTAIREHAELMVRNEVVHCVSSMVSTILQASDTWRALEIDEDEAYTLAECLDFDEPAAEHIRNMDADELRDYLESRDVDFDSGTEDEDGETIGGTSVDELRRLATAELAEHGAHDFCDEFSIEPDRGEVFEHWIVSSWLANRLEDAGHPIVRDFMGLTIWGRPTTGQSIAMDSVILEIARDSLKA